MSKDWADEDSDDDVSPEDLRKRMGGVSAPAPSEDRSNREASPGIASLASRIGGLSTDESQKQPPSSPAAKERPRPNTSNPLFGKALAGASRSAPPTKSEQSSSSGSPLKATAPSFKPSAAAPAFVPASPTKAKTEDKTESKSEEPSKPPPESTTKKEDTMDDGWGNPVVTGGDEEVKSEGMATATVSGLISNEFRVEVKLADLQADPNSPLYSISTFEELPIHEDLRKGIYAVGFKKPSKIQEKALPMLLKNPPQNLIGQSQSGTGKTAAFALDMLSRVDPALMTPQAICLAPSRELARQIQSVIDQLGQFTQIKTFLAVPRSWRRGVKINDHILIGTPGTLVDMLSQRAPIFDPRQIRVFVLDEADEMIQLQGLGDQTFRIKKMLPEGVQNVLFSATFPDDVQDFATRFAPEANQIFLKREDVTVDAIKQLYLVCDGQDAKFDALSALYDVMTIGQSIVFCKKKITADEIWQRLTAEGHSVVSLHGDKTPEERDSIIDGFRNGKSKVLITTNVVARGIDVMQVNMVVNYDIPDTGPEGGWQPDIETYIHRIGRTGRFGRKGCAVTFVHDDRSMDDVNTIMQETGRSMKKITVDTSDLDQLEEALKIAMKNPADA